MNVPRERAIAHAASLTVLSSILLFASLPSASGLPRDSGRNEWVSPTEWGPSNQGINTDPSISANGRYVVFLSSPTPRYMPINDANGGPDVFFRDMSAGQTRAISVTPTGDQTGNGPSYGGVISANGRYAAFVSQATDLDLAALGDDSYNDVFVRDLQSDSTLLASRSINGPRGGNNSSDHPRMTSDGRYVVYESKALDLVQGVTATGYTPQIYRYDRVANVNTLISISASGDSNGDGESGEASITDDGRYVVFTSSAQNLVADATYPSRNSNVFLRDIALGITRLLSHEFGSMNAATGSSPMVSANGSIAIFDSGSDSIVSSDSNHAMDVFAYHVAMNSTEVVSVTSSGDSSDGLSELAKVSSDGSKVAFLSMATNLDIGYSDANNLPPGTIPPIGYQAEDVFVRDLTARTTKLVTKSANGPMTSNRGGINPQFSGDGNYLAFESDATDLVAGLREAQDDNQTHSDVFRYQLSTGEIRAVSLDDCQDFSTLYPPSYQPTISSDGRFIAFQNVASPGVWSQIYRRDMQADPSSWPPTCPKLPSPPPPPSPTSLTSGPDVSSWAPGRLDVFARGADNALVHKWYQDGWSAWESLGGVLTADPGAVSWDANRIDVFVRGTDGSLYHKWWDGSAWRGWEPLGGVIAEGTGPEITTWGPGRLDVFVKGTDNQLWHRWYSGGWSEWEPLGGVLASDPAAVAWSSGRIDVFVKGTDNQLWHKWYDGGWSGWEALGGSLTSAPDAASWAPGRLDVFARGPDNTLIHKWYQGSWGGFESLSGNLASVPGAVSWGANRIDVFARAPDGALGHKWWDSAAWSAWESQGSP